MRVVQYVGQHLPLPTQMEIDLGLNNCKAPPKPYAVALCFPHPLLCSSPTTQPASSANKQTTAIYCSSPRHHPRQAVLCLAACTHGPRLPLSSLQLAIWDSRASSWRQQAAWWRTSPTEVSPLPPCLQRAVCALASCSQTQRPSHQSRVVLCRCKCALCSCAGGEARPCE